MRNMAEDLEELGWTHGSLRMAAILLVALISLACDGSLWVEGSVYRWEKPPASARSLAIVDSSAPLPPDLQPLADARITIYHSPEYAHRTDETARLWRSTATSESDGSFDTGGACTPGSYDMAVGATHDGCQSVFQTFRHSTRQPDTRMTIILVCEP